MKILITETQYKKIILEERQKNIISKLENLKKFFDDVVDDAKTQIGLDLGFLTTWGVSIAGFVQPVTQFIEGRFPELSSTDLLLISTGIILTYFQSNKEKVKKILDKIKERELIFEFDRTLSVCEKLKDVFINFIDSLKIPLSRVSNMLAYTFLIPILPELYETAQGIDSIDIRETILRITSFITLSFGGPLVKKLINLIVIRFKN